MTSPAASHRQADGRWALCLLRVPQERGVWRTLPLRQHVDGQDLLPGCLRHHGHLCKWTSRRRPLVALIPLMWLLMMTMTMVPSLSSCLFQTLSVSMLLRYSHHQIFVFIGQFPVRSPVHTSAPQYTVVKHSRSQYTHQYIPVYSSRAQ